MCKMIPTNLKTKSVKRRNENKVIIRPRFASRQKFLFGAGVLWWCLHLWFVTISTGFLNLKKHKTFYDQFMTSLIQQKLTDERKFPLSIVMQPCILPGRNHPRLMCLAILKLQLESILTYRKSTKTIRQSCITYRFEVLYVDNVSNSALINKSFNGHNRWVVM